MPNPTLQSYYLGAVLNIVGKFTTSTGSTVGVDPAGLTFGMKEPDGATYSYTYSATSTSVFRTTASGYPTYYVNWQTAKEGIHRGGYVGTGSNAGAIEFAFNVLRRGY